MSESPPRYLDTIQAAAWVGLSPRTLARMRVTGDGPPYAKWGRRVIYDRFDLDDWVARRKRRFTGESIDEGEPSDESDPAEDAEESGESEPEGE